MDCNDIASLRAPPGIELAARLKIRMRPSDTATAPTLIDDHASERQQLLWRSLFGCCLCFASCGEPLDPKGAPCRVSLFTTHQRSLVGVEQAPPH